MRIANVALLSAIVAASLAAAHDEAKEASVPDRATEKDPFPPFANEDPCNPPCDPQKEEWCSITYKIVGTYPKTKLTYVKKCTKLSTCCARNTWAGSQGFALPYCFDKKGWPPSDETCQAHGYKTVEQLN